MSTGVNFQLSSFCIIGAGAIGGLLGINLALDAKADVTLIARGTHLKAIQSNGLRLIRPDGTERLWENVKATDDLDSLEGDFDVIIIAVKSHQVELIAHKIERLCHKNTIIVTIQNGLPWWYFYKHGGELDGMQLKSLDPTERLWQHIRLDRIIGCIAFGAASISSPGVIHHSEGYGFPLGEPNRTNSERATALSKVLTTAGFRAPVRKDFREEVWLKLLGNLTFNPISALTGATVADITNYQQASDLCRDMMLEAEQVAKQLGCTLRVSVDRRLQRARDLVGDHKTSMLQDVEKGKPIEVDILNGVVEVASLTRSQIPAISAIAKCTNLLNHVLEKNTKSKL